MGGGYCLSSRTRPFRSSAPLACHLAITTPTPSPPNVAAPLPPWPSGAATPERYNWTCPSRRNKLQLPPGSALARMRKAERQDARGKRRGVRSSPDEETEVPSQLLGQLEKDPAPFPLSQNSAGKFVPQFAKPRKTVTRRAEMKEEDIKSGAVDLEMPQEPSASQAGSQQLQASLGLALPEEGGPEDRVVAATGAHPKQQGQLSPEPVPGSGAFLPVTSTDSYPSWGSMPSASERASQDHLPGPGTHALDGGNKSLVESRLVEEQQGNGRPGTQKGLAPQSLGQKGPPPSSESEGKELHRGAPQKEGEGVLGILGPISSPVPAQGLSPVSQSPEPGSAAQGCPDHVQTPSKPVVIFTERITDPTVPPPGALQVARLDGQAPSSGHSGALPHSSEAVGGRGEAELGDEPPSNAPGPPAASLAPALENQEPTVGTGDSSPLTLEVGPGVDPRQLSGPSQEGLRGACAQPSPVESISGKADEPSGKSPMNPEPSGHSLALHPASLQEHREVVDGPPQPPQGPGAPAAPGPADQAVWGGSSTMELDFLPDSQMQDVLDAPSFTGSLEQPSAGSTLSPCWPGTNPPVNGGSSTTAQPRTPDSGNKPFKDPGLEDATDTVCGLIVELSNLNRLIMSTHRDLEAFKRLSYRKAKPTGKMPVPYASRGAGSLPRGEQPWRDL
ncbi:break repair meiotic recombinase recruitment factor 1 [Orycteropus afer afer]|uniref:Break repair meiotic recombinase recruitment factor 1 n=1 Tax=Orycteropus afer afer TaxID=1230840 RepID=A0A8B7AYE0_ORYAF|nr:break repair meiotic recombinase recruitment factor 1 [Orycteropus afer afer]